MTLASKNSKGFVLERQVEETRSFMVRAEKLDIGLTWVDPTCERIQDPEAVQSGSHLCSEPRTRSATNSCFLRWRTASCSPRLVSIGYATAEPGAMVTALLESTLRPGFLALSRRIVIALFHVVRQP